MFLLRRPEVFRMIKEVKYLSGGVVLYPQVANAQIDVEIAEQSG